MASAEKKAQEDSREDHSNGIQVLQGRRGGSSGDSSFGRRSVHSAHSEHELLPSHCQRGDRDWKRTVHEDFSVSWQQDALCRKTGTEEDPKHESQKDWFKITIPLGRKYDKAWLINLIQRNCSAPFTPVDFHYIERKALFFVQDANVASAISEIKDKLHDENNETISVCVTPSTVPYSQRNKFSSEEVHHLQLVLKRRYDASQRALNLQKLRFDPDLRRHKVDMVLNRRNCMAATLEVIKKDFPELLSLNLRSNKLYQLNGLSDIVEIAPNIKILDISRNELKSICELDKVMGLKLEELWVHRNPLCHTFSSQSSYVRAVQDRFPNLSLLDGLPLHPPVTPDIGVSKILKPCKESFKGYEALKDLVLRFVHEYFFVYDYGDRQYLFNAYHDEACFSLTIPLQPEDLEKSALREYFMYSRNMKKLKNLYVRRQLLRHKKQAIADFLRVLPKTQHDCGNFVMDIWLQTETMLCFTVSGVFKETQGTSEGCIRAFTRTFIAVPTSNSYLAAVNDQLFVRDARPDEIQRAFSMATPAATPTPSCMATLSEEQQRMVQLFSLQSGMKLEWSQKCLLDNEWNYPKAARIFIMLRMQSKIPAEAFT